MPSRPWLIVFFCCVCSMALSAQTAVPRIPVLVIAGPPGSGKTTQAKLLSQQYKIPSFSMASLLTAELGKQKKSSRALQASLASGELLGDDAANRLIATRLLQADAGKGFILDGYPTTAAQARFLDQTLQQAGLPLPKVILLDASDEVVRERMLNRKRADDESGNIDRRLQEFHADAGFLTTWYKPENVVQVDASLPELEVAQRIRALLEEALSRRPFATREPQ